MSEKIYLRQIKFYLSKSALFIALALITSCVHYGTIRNENTSLIDGYDPESQKVYVGKIRLKIDGLESKHVTYKIPYLRNFLAGSTGATSYSSKTVDRNARSSTNKEGYFAANLRENSVTQTGVESFSFYSNYANVNGGAVFPIKIYPDFGLYYFGDVLIETETNSIGVPQFKNVTITNNPQTMNLIAEMVPEMAKLKRYNVADETIDSFKKLLKKKQNSQKLSTKNNAHEEKRTDEKKVIADF